VLVNNAITTVTNTSTGGAIASYAISPAAPAGLTFSTTTGQLSGTPTSIQSATAYTVTATNAAGSATRTFTLTVTVGTPAFSLSSVAETRVATTAITGYTITSTGAPITSYSLVGTLPANVNFDTSTGRITGTPTETRTATTYTIIGASASGETATATYRLRVTGDIGDIGPGGGNIFYYLAAGFACGPTRAATCKYLEAAVSNWSGGADPAKYWEPNQLSFTDTTVASIPTETSVNNSSGAVGLGYKYTLAIYGQSSDTSTAAAAARAYSPIVSGTTITDWYLPTSTELNLMCQWQRGVTQSVSTVCSGGALNGGSGASGFSTSNYWASSQYNKDVAWSQNFGTGVQVYLNTFKNNEGGVNYVLRPIRAF
jgi:hypothetical protein